MTPEVTGTSWSARRCFDRVSAPSFSCGGEVTIFGAPSVCRWASIPCTAIRGRARRLVRPPDRCRSNRVARSDRARGHPRKNLADSGIRVADSTDHRRPRRSGRPARRPAVTRSISREVSPLALRRARGCSGSDVDAYLETGVAQSERDRSSQVGARPDCRSATRITNRDVPGVTAVQLQAALDRAFSVWSSVPTASISVTVRRIHRGLEPGESDNQTSVIGFRSRPDLDRVLGSTSFILDQTTGAIIESDIFLNTTVNWSVAAGGEPSRYDVESIAVHEIGHLLGLGHSALGETDLLPGGRVDSRQARRDVPDRLCTREHRGSDARSRRHRRDLGRLSKGRVHDRHGRGHGAGDCCPGQASSART